MAHAWALLRDVDRLADCRRRLDVSPLGAGALAGSSLPLDPDGTAEDIGFSARFENSLDATSDRDFVAESLFVVTMVGLHLSRMGEEIVLWTTDEFGFARLDDAYTTGSSMLPQKKNPDIAELARGKAGRLIGDLTGLPGHAQVAAARLQPRPAGGQGTAVRRARHRAAGPGRDGGLYRTLQFRPERMRAAADSPYAAATDLAEFLVRDGVPFRDAHAIVGALVRDARWTTACRWRTWWPAEPTLGPAAAVLLGPGVSVRQRTTPGGAGPVAVAEQRRRLGVAVQRERARWSDGAPDA